MNAKEKTMMVRLSLPYENLVQMTNDGKMVNLFVQVQDVPVGEVAQVIVKDVKNWEDFNKSEYIRDKARLRIQPSMSRVVLQKEV